MSLSDWVVYLWNLRFLPLRIRWPILKWRRRILHPRSPLDLRYTYRMASALQHPHQKPFFVIVRLLWPFPSWRFPAVIPGTPSEIVQQRNTLIERARDLYYLRCMPLWRWRDTPQRSLYRMYEAVVVDTWPMLQYEVEYFWKHGDRSWATANLYDPAEDCPTPIDAQRHNIMAAIVEELVKSFHWRLELGLRRTDPGSRLDQEKMPLIPETLPTWPSSVKPLPEMLPLQDCDDEDLVQRETKKGNAFISRNILAFAGEFYTV
ncbi:hypothetical protein VTK73DRAFT_1146 [Phialemonium thermophilum]|uniref:Uncharacterized protein n=1 Tax=Phialemonium thermophilum TaxID=223376 RepID=A0ABR3XBU3_9PEZI